jgi:hypothetical protein
MVVGEEDVHDSLPEFEWVCCLRQSILYTRRGTLEQTLDHCKWIYGLVLLLNLISLKHLTPFIPPHFLLSELRYSTV